MWYVRFLVVNRSTGFRESSGSILSTFTCILSYCQTFKHLSYCQTFVEEQLKVNEWCRAASPSVNMIVADARGLYAQVFTDFGPKFTVVDTTGEAPITAMFASITVSTLIIFFGVALIRQGKASIQQVKFKNLN